ncbi:hypothetical protein [Deinococcus sonorensis]|uniref:Uncharacterized protein n=1 Tax=Deinococcus sonorensis TaxID=309891 RepID=A0ABV8Y8K6_9DEIO
MQKELSVLRNRRHLLTGSSLVVGLLAAVIVRAQAPASKAALTARVIDGRAYVAVRDLQRLVQLRYHPAARQVILTRVSAFIPGSSEGAFGSGPTDFASLGGVMAVRQALNAEQQQSLAHPERVLLRFEIISSGSADPPSTLLQGIPKGYQPKFTVTALLYWASPTSTGEARLTRATTTNGSEVSLAGPTVGPAAVEMRRYITAPRDVQASADQIAFGLDHWTVLSQDTVPLPHGVQARTTVPMYDPSLQQIEPPAPRR